MDAIICSRDAADTKTTKTLMEVAKFFFFRLVYFSG
jgi:hypothetical protein